MNILRKIAGTTLSGLVFFMVYGCSHPIEIEGDGDVESASTTRTCTLEDFQSMDPVCTENYVVFAYNETYEAKPRSGWEFGEWVNCSFNGLFEEAGKFCTFNVTGETVSNFWGETMPPLKARFFEPLLDPSLFPVYDPDNVSPPPPKDEVFYDVNRQVFFGDMHVHTALSHDAYNFGTRTYPADAYTFAKGGEIEGPTGLSIQLKRPLDFLAVTDHAEYMGHLDQPGFTTAPMDGVDLRELLLQGWTERITTLFSQQGQFVQNQPWINEGPADPAILSDAWAQTVAAAENANDPGVFTAFIGFEYSSFPDRVYMLHRNVIFRDNIVPPLPYSKFDSSGPFGPSDPEGLWAEMDIWESTYGTTAISIPHNGNRSNGWMYDTVDFAEPTFESNDPNYPFGSNDPRQPLDAAYAAQRMSKEPISEVFQIKGASETHPELSPNDPFAGFEISDTLLSAEGGKSDPPGSYYRDALRTGLELSHSSGFNPYRIGAIGSSDSHMSTAPIEEDDYTGKWGLFDGTAGLRTLEALDLPAIVLPQDKWGSGGVAAVWAEENTRASLYDAMVRKETYATSGPLIQLRFFASYDAASLDPNDPDPIANAYAGGVPMGGDLAPAPPGTSPKFLVWAWFDNLGAYLDRLQVVKVWVDAGGVSHEMVYNVAASDGRIIDPVDNSVPDVGNTVDPLIPSYTNTIGDPELVAVWEDPDFDETLEAIYYARALEIPTPRWSTYDAVTLGISAPPPKSPDSPVSIQERAVTSGIFYSP